MDYIGLLKELHRRELPSGGWSFSGSPQMSLETTCLATFSVLAEQPSSAPHVVRPLLNAQFSGGSWPSFIGDGEPSWTTALAICVLNSANDSSGARERGLSWLLKTNGREANWFWRWKFKLADRAVRWMALDLWFGQLGHSHCVQRIRLGVDMLLDRVCLGGGWNSVSFRQACMTPLGCSW